jgi:hypothetical protein
MNYLTAGKIPTLSQKTRLGWGNPKGNSETKIPTQANPGLEWGTHLYESVLLR